MFNSDKMCNSEKVSWKFLSAISKNQFVKNTLIWVVIVPIVAKFLSAIENTITITFDEKQYIFVLSLPFTWSLFYFSAFFFLIGHILYKVCVPTIINDNESYADFLSTGKGKHELLKYIEKERLSEDGFFELYTDEYLKEELKHDFFWEIWNQTNLLRCPCRMLIALLYSIAVTLLVLVFVQNFWFVSNHIPQM